MKFTLSGFNSYFKKSYHSKIVSWLEFMKQVQVCTSRRGYSFFIAWSCRAVSMTISHDPGFWRIWSCCSFSPSMPRAMVTFSRGHSCRMRVISGKIRF